MFGWLKPSFSDFFQPSQNPTKNPNKICLVVSTSKHQKQSKEHQKPLKNI